MVAFLDKLKKRVNMPEAESAEAQVKVEKTPQDYLQLNVDIYQTNVEIIIYASVPGAKIADLEISIEGENDVVTIQGKSELPEEEKNRDDGEFLRHECVWGDFYRQIILPQEVDVESSDATLTDGILILKLPLMRIIAAGKKKISIKAG